MLSRVTRFSSLKRWALNVARRRGLKRAKVALAGTVRNFVRSGAVQLTTPWLV
jgi:hypothetical protein